MGNAAEIQKAIIAELQLELVDTKNIISTLSAKLKTVDTKVASLEAQFLKTKDELILQENFNNVVIHDLRSTAINLNQLSVIVSEEDDLKHERNEFLSMIQNKSVRMLALIDTNIAMSKLEDHSFDLQQNSIDVTSVINEVAKQNTPLLKYKNITIEKRLLDTNLSVDSNIYIFGEEALVFSVLNNIIVNAIEGSLTNSTVSIAISKNKACSIAVHNLGEVPEKIRDTFFKKFVTAGKKRGSGIGTYSALLLAKAMHGNVMLDTSEAGATTVTITFPITKDITSDS